MYTNDFLQHMYEINPSTRLIINLTWLDIKHTSFRPFLIYNC